jgi:hypothetical protein
MKGTEYERKIGFATEELEGILLEKPLNYAAIGDRRCVRGRKRE